MDRPDDHTDQPDQSQPAQPQEQPQWQYKPAGQTVAGAKDAPFLPAENGPIESSNDNLESPVEVEWTASEFVAHDKGFSWYILLTLAALVIAGGIYIVTKDLFSTVVVLLLAIIMAIAGSRKPRVLTYRLDGHGISAGTRFHPYGNYKSFAFLEEEPFASIVLIPLKRFGMPFSVYLDPSDEQRVVETLSRHLPLERGQLDSVDRLMRRVRF